MKNSRYMPEKNVDTKTDMLAFYTSGKEFHIIIPLWRKQYFILNLFTRINTHLFVGLVLWLWIWFLLMKNSTLFLHQYWSVIIRKCSSKLEGYTNWKVKRFYYIWGMRWYVHCIYARLFIARTVFYWRRKILEV